MRNISFLTLIVGLVALVWGCKDEDKIRIPEFPTAANMRIVVDPAHATINSTSVATDFVAFDLFSENQDLSLVEMLLSYKDQQVVIATYTQSDFNDGQERLEFNASDLATWFGVPGFADGSRGGNFTLRPRVTLNDGRVYPSWIRISDTDSIYNIGTDITGSPNSAFTLQANTAILCPPVDISGTYTVVSATGTSTDGCCPGEVSISGNTVTITPVAGSAINFNVSDITGGLYFEWYDVYGITAPEDSPGVLVFNCNEVLIPNSPEPFGTAFSGGGTWDGTTSTITYTWTNGYADVGTVVLRRM